MAKFSDSATAQRPSFKSAVATVDDGLREKLERAKREGGESQLRNMAGMLVFEFEQDGDNEWLFSSLPDFMQGMEVEHGKAKGQPVTLKSLYSAVSAHVKSQNGVNVCKPVWSEKAGVLALVRTDREGEFEPTLKPRTRKTAAEKAAEDTEPEATEPDTDAE